MFGLGREEFPVDTHVWEMAKQLGWVPPRASREDAYSLLNGPGGVPPDIK
jgi:endonuclease-3